MNILNVDYMTIRRITADDSYFPIKYSREQYRVLYRLIEQKNVKREFFYALLSALFNISDWKQLSYMQMYTIIHILLKM